MSDQRNERAAFHRTSLKKLVAEILGKPLDPAELRRLTRLCTAAPKDPSRLAEATRLPDEVARKLWVALELGRRFWGPNSQAADLGSLSLRSPETAARFFANALRQEEVEEFHVALLDTRHRLKGRERIARGSLSHVEVHPRDVFVPAVRSRAAAVLIAHNHPSGDPEPSLDDILLTNRLTSTGDLLGIPVLDHLIVTQNSAYVSFLDRGLLKKPPAKTVRTRRSSASRNENRPKARSLALRERIFLS